MHLIVLLVSPWLLFIDSLINDEGTAELANFKIFEAETAESMSAISWNLFGAYMKATKTDDYTPTWMDYIINYMNEKLSTY